MALSNSEATLFKTKLSTVLRVWPDFAGVKLNAAEQGGHHATITLRVLDGANVQSYERLPSTIKETMQAAHQELFGRELSPQDIIVQQAQRAQGLGDITIS